MNVRGMIINRAFLDFIYGNAEGGRSRIYLATGLNGACMAFMMYALSVGLEDFSATNEVSLRAMLMFALALAAYYFSQAYGSRLCTASVLKGLGDLELRVMDKLRRVDYAAFSELRPELVYAAVGGDKYGAVLASRFLIPTMSAMIVVVITGAYLCTVSIPGALLVAGALFAVIVVRGSLSKNISARKKEDAAAADIFTVSLKDIVEGFNELKMNREKSDALFGEKIEPASSAKNGRLLGTELYQMRSTVLEQATLFLPLGLTLFVLPLLFEASLSDLIQIVSVTLIVIWPAYTLVQSGPLTSAAADILSRLNELDTKLDSSELEPVCEKPGDYPVAPEFSKLACSDIAYAYPKRGADEKAFTLEIGGFSMEKGELIIMRGGNGSGKSTFMRILAGLAKPSGGTIEVNGVGVVEIGDANYRALFSIVMADFHLFDKFYGIEKPEGLEKWAAILRLENKVGDVLPTESLSSGQKKRMALLAAILENRQILLLDEVAADFDPRFREAYYRQVLPGLKAEGRTLLVISHDDRYYDVADRVVTMREGSLIEEKRLVEA